MQPYRFRKDEAAAPNSHPLQDHPLFTGATSVGMMSGEQPRYPAMPGGHEALVRDLRQLGLQHEETTGSYGGPERSVIIYGPTRDQMHQLGKKYGQEAVIHSQAGRHEFLYTGGPNEGASHPGLPTFETWGPQDEPDDYYTKVPDKGYIRLHFDFDHVDHQLVNIPQPATPGALPMTKAELGGTLLRALQEVLKNV